MEDKSGIYSLAGFAYQIKIFALQIPNLHADEYVGYEIVDDIAVKTSLESLDDVDSTCAFITKDSLFEAIQVKNTLVSPSGAKRIIMNWMSSQIEKHNIGKFLLITSNAETNIDVLQKVSFDDIYDAIESALLNKRSLEAKLKKLHLTRKELKDYFDYVVNNSEIKIITNSEAAIYDAYKDFFILDGVVEYTYLKRLEQFLMHITNDLLNMIQKGIGYKLNYQKVQQMRNQYITCISDERYEPCFSDFKKIRKININEVAQLKKREYQQLCECIGLDDTLIIQNLLLGEFYAECKRHYCDLGKLDVPEAIEETAHSNFCDVKAYLKARNEDTPDNRLHNTKEKANAHAQSDEIRKGVCINLTGAQISSELQISWKD